LLEGGEGIGLIGNTTDVDAQKLYFVVQLSAVEVEIKNLFGAEFAGVEAVLETVAVHPIR
jgi:hypothetical protein